jgi:hypothetical protein
VLPVEEVEENCELPVPAEKVEDKVLELAIRFLKMHHEEAMTPIPKVRAVLDI